LTDTSLYIYMNGDVPLLPLYAFMTWGERERERGFYDTLRCLKFTHVVKRYCV